MKSAVPYPPISRRDFCSSIALATAAAAAAAARAPRAHARAVIWLWMNGGLPHTDTFDPKPDAGATIAGPLRSPIRTVADGIRIGELLPNLARQADKFSILRGMTHPRNGHDAATALMISGSSGDDPSALRPGWTAISERGHRLQSRSRSVRQLTDRDPPGRSVPRGRGAPRPSGATPSPVSLGSLIARARGFSGSIGGLPPQIALTQRIGRFMESDDVPACLRAVPAPGDPTAPEYSRQVAAANPRYEDLRPFDLMREADPRRDRYGRNAFGQSCLVARRLVECGVPFVTVNMGGWDTHVDHFDRVRPLAATLDRGFAALLEDLSASGLLETTIVVCCGEFGRTPRIDFAPPWNGGRHHHADVFSAVVAGGGFRGGQIVGASDARGESVAERPITPSDLAVGICELMGIDPPMVGDAPPRELV